jgi:hypothetical protein
MVSYIYIIGLATDKLSDMPPRPPSRAAGLEPRGFSGGTVEQSSQLAQMVDNAVQVRFNQLMVCIFPTNAFTFNSLFD